MAIPLYVPEEYGPLPQASAIQQCSNNQIRQLVSRKSFLQRLILELCSIHQEYCAASVQRAANPSVAGPGSPDVNNNTNFTFPPVGDAAPGSRASCTPSSSRRRRHQAGKDGLPDLATCHHDLMEPLTATAAPNDLALKPLVEENFTTLGFKLRQIADSYAQKASKKGGNNSGHHAERAQSRGKLQPQRLRRRFAVSSLFAISAVTVAAAAAAFVFIKRE